ncbi:hypothetical protein M199_gp047 [Halogranum tailed virus 1]|uniref:Uncharacterized protein n=1 Tax=Halogranum tailed virus 1 TaxID=1273749 RepID=R4TL26_9CAUD|nr:hypothetical protein M199_gp047 [Halogranum tailed virus 1]AGM11377.1 hypothetical protein HGTV1_47 [Halogranum tailed virus 1]
MKRVELIANYALITLVVIASMQVGIALSVGVIPLAALLVGFVSAGLVTYAYLMTPKDLSMFSSK